MNKQMLQLRNEKKEKNPSFIRQDIQKKARLGVKWRKPKGVHSKIRHNFKGRRRMPLPGYRTPAEARGLHTSGLEIKIVHSLKDIENINNKETGIIVASSVGTKKKYEILKKAKSSQIQLLNTNLDEQIKKIEEFIESRKKKSAFKKTQKKEEKKEAKPEITEEPKKDADEKEKKETEKKEKDKVLTKKV